MWRITTFAFLAALFTASAGAQDLSGLQAGAKLKIDRAGKPTVEGVLLDVSTDSVRLRTITGSWTVPRAEFTQVRVSRGGEGRGRSALRKGGIGALGGIVVGAALGLADGDDPAGGWFSMTGPEKAALGGTVLGTIGLIVGSVIGAATPTERWEPVPLP